MVHAAVSQDDHTLLRMVVVKLRESHDHQTVCRVLNKQNEDGYTPLHQAAADGYNVGGACSSLHSLSPYDFHVTVMNTMQFIADVHCKL